MIRNAIRDLGVRWARDERRPRIEKSTAERWHDALERCSEDKDVPLLVRKQRSDIGRVLHHAETNRKLVPVDNSPAQWAFTSAFNGQFQTDEEIHAELIKGKAIPVALVLPNIPQAAERYGVQLAPPWNINTEGWKLAHLHPIGMHGRTRVQVRTIDSLKIHFVQFLSPANMFLVPREFAGLAEVPAFLEGFRSGLEDA